MRFGKSVWHSKRIEDDNAEIPSFEKPIEIVTRPNYFTVMPMASRGFIEVLKYGEKLDDTWTVTANARAFEGQFKKGDLMWVDDNRPNELESMDYGYGYGANAIVKSVAEINNTISIILERYQG